MLRRHVLTVALIAVSTPLSAQDGERLRVRDYGVAVGVFETGEHNAITDVAGVRVGHTTVVEAPDVRTGVTAILPHGGNPYLSRVPAAIHVGNGFGKLLGVTQVRELGEMETPILLTCTLCVWKAADAMVEWMLARDGMENVRSLNALVGETNDGSLNDIRSRPIEAEHVVAALESATEGPVEEGAVGAGAGTVAFGWKGGIGTSSRVLPASLGGYTVGVLVQSNFGGILQVAGAPVGIELGQYAFADQVGRDDAYDPEEDAQEWGSIMMVVATDAPLSDRNLERVARRAVMGLSRTGSYASNGSGRLRHRLLDRERRATTHQRRRARLRRSREQRHQCRLRGHRRGDGGSDLQLDVQGGDRDEQRTHGRGAADRRDVGGPPRLRRHPMRGMIPGSRTSAESDPS